MVLGWLAAGCVRMPVTWDPPPNGAIHAVASAELRSAARALEEALTDTWATGGPTWAGLGPVADGFRVHHPDGSPVVDPLGAFPSGLVATVALAVADGEPLDLGPVVLDADGPRLLGIPTFDREDVEVHLAPRHRSLAGAARITTRERLFQVGLGPWFWLAQAVRGDARCTVAHRRMLLVVDCPDGAEPIALAWWGRVPSTDADALTPEEVMLRLDTQWFPMADAGATALTVSLVHPASLLLSGQGELADGEPADEAGARDALPAGYARSTWRWTGTSMTVWGGEGRVVTPLATDGPVAIDLVSLPDERDAMAIAGRTAADTIARLQWLGPYPADKIRLVATGFHGGYGALTNIGLDRTELDRAWFVAHEVAHGWAPYAFRTMDTGYEPLAEYLANRALPDDAALARRERWASGMRKVSQDRSNLEIDPSEPWSRNFGINYARGAAILTAAEDRLGREAFDALLAGHFAARRGGEGGLAALISDATAADAAFGGWLGGWLSTPGLPAIGLAADPDGDADAIVVRADPRGFALDVVLSFDVGAPLTVAATDDGRRIAWPEGARAASLDPQRRAPFALPEGATDRLTR